MEPRSKRGRPALDLTESERKRRIRKMNTDCQRRRRHRIATAIESTPAQVEQRKLVLLRAQIPPIEQETTPIAAPVRTSPQVDLVDPEDIEPLAQAKELADELRRCSLDPPKARPRGFSAFNAREPHPPSTRESSPVGSDSILNRSPPSRLGGSTPGFSIPDQALAQSLYVPGPHPRPTPAPSIPPSIVGSLSDDPPAFGSIRNASSKPPTAAQDFFKKFATPPLSIDKRQSSSWIAPAHSESPLLRDQDAALPSIEESLLSSPDQRSNPFGSFAAASTRFEPGSDGTHDDNGEDTAEDYVVTTARAVLDAFTDFPGCSESEHAAEAATHDAECAGRHQDLFATFDPNIPDVLREDQFLGDAPDQILKSSSITVPQIYRSLHGCDIPERREEAAQPELTPVCLHEEKVTTCRPKIVPDQDSFLGFASSGQVERKAFHWTPVPNMMLNIKSNLHLDNDGRRRHRPRQKPNDDPDAEEEGLGESDRYKQDPTKLAIRDTPHCLFGDSEGTRGLRYYLLFPHLEVKGNSFQALTGHQIERLTDKILLPALQYAVPNHIVNRYPCSFGEALANAQAAQKEQRKTDGKGYQGLSGFGYPIPAAYTGAMWDRMQDIIDNTPGLYDFRDFQLFFNAKGVKLLHKDEQNLYRSLIDFENHITSVLDLDYVFLDQFYVDIAQEIICPESLTQVYLYRTCCLESLRKKIFGPAETRSGTHRTFIPAFLRDAANMNSVPSIRSRLRRAGLIFMQAYGTWNSQLDAAKTYPFTHDYMEELAMNTELRKAMAAVGRTALHQLHVIEEAYLSSKRRVSRALTGSISRAYGVRLEFRISWPLYLAIQGELESHHPPASTSMDQLPAIPRFVYAVETDRFNHFLYGNANKFAAVFEYVRDAHVRGGRGWTWEATGIMAMLLRLLRFSLLSHDLAAEGALWWNRRVFPSTNRRWAGLAMQRNIARAGYAWVKPVVLWAAFRWMKGVRYEMLFTNKIIRGFQAHRSDVNDLRTDSQYLERCGHWLARFRDPKQQEFLLKLMVHVCLRWFRFDVLRKVYKCYPHLKRDKTQLDNEQPDEDAVHLAVEPLRRIVGDEPYIAANNRSVRTPADMFEYLFAESCPNGDEPSKVRKHWDDLGFRFMYREGRAIFAKSAIGYHNDARWVEEFSRELVGYHWLWPCLDKASGVWCKPVEKRLATSPHPGIAFWALKRRVGKAVSGDLHGWKWGGPKKEFQPGSPPPYPTQLTWEPARVERWLRDCLIERVTQD
ncbi:MAG: hypothetical protein LQ337_002593 [Flavoplaca oasis]|nr:MAG: hypothetical protein LQ337_002593 [Flavoplaca oasis]